MADNPVALPSPPARAGMTAWTTWTNDGHGGLAGAAAMGRRRAGEAWPGAPLRGAEQPGWPGTSGRRPTGVGRGRCHGEARLDHGAPARDSRGGSGIGRRGAVGAGVERGGSGASVVAAAGGGSRGELAAADAGVCVRE
ncbi:uncharacterized protein [Miscanthus floridulus]|uniref:uncharacterized protein n=1 Tax=Miscanthus floridulus TaxID=154761 RepID=UPI003458E230